MSINKKHIYFQIKSLEDSPENPDVAVIKGYGAIFGNIDSDGDIIMKGAFVEALTKRTPKMAWQHDLRSPIGIWDVVKEDDIGLYMEGRIFKNIQKGNEAAILIKEKAIDGLSIGFSLNFEDVVFETRGDRQVQIIKKVEELFETSIVTIPANDQATVNSIKSISELCGLKEVEKLLKSKAGLSQKESKALISKIKEFSTQRDVEDDKQRDVAPNELEEICHFQQLSHIKSLLTKK